MKTIAIILLILVNTFVAFPCTDDHSSEQEHQSELVEVDCSELHTEFNENEAETCTPFCVCSCCHTQIVELSKQNCCKPIVYKPDYTERHFNTLDYYKQPDPSPPKV
ncbi:MAG: DUF6660 family protein [Chlorobiota bacterium]